MAKNTEVIEDMIPDEADRPTKTADKVQPLYQVYEGSRIPVGKAVGPMFKKRLDAAMHAHSITHEVWEEIFKYYNFHHKKTITTPRGTFRQGDGSENVIYSNVNITLPAVYSKNPDISCSTIDGADEPFCQAMQSLINVLLRRPDAMKAKNKVKRAAGFALLTNFGVLKLDFTKKDDSREFVIRELEKLSGELAKAKKQEDAERIWGEMEALEMSMEVRKPSGFTLGNVLPQNLIIDPNAEQPDGEDAELMMERVWFPTAALNARYTRKKDKESDDRVLLYKPTHKAMFDGSAERDDGLGMVMSELSGSENTTAVTSHTEDERRAYTEMYYTECYFVWDKVFRRVYLFHRDDWAWPLWVWDDPLKTSRFFPYFLISLGFSTGGVVTPGDIAYILDQQDQINDINRQWNRIRRAVFDYIFYDKTKIDGQEVEKFMKAIRGETTTSQHAFGVDPGERPVKEAIEVYVPPAMQYEKLFDKQGTYDAVDRLTNTSDAIRGVQFKTNTTEDAVQTYRESMQLSIGSKVDVIEDCMTDICYSVAEIAVQNYDQETVAGYIGETQAAGWQEMDIETFRSTYSVEITPGSMEKPTSIFKKKEAIEIVTAVGQFATAAPGATLMIMLKVLSKAFTEINIKQEDWDALAQEVQANLTRGQSTGGGVGAEGSEGGSGEGPSADDVNALSPEDQADIKKAGESGASDEELRMLIERKVRGNQHPQPNQQQPNQQQLNQQTGVSNATRA